MAERPVCGTCDGHGQTRASSQGPWTLCVVCQGAGRVDDVGHAVHDHHPFSASSVMTRVSEPSVLGPRTIGHPHYGHLYSRGEDNVWHCDTCPDHPVVELADSVGLISGYNTAGAPPHRVGDPVPVSDRSSSRHDGHWQIQDAHGVWHCDTCPDHPVVTAPAG